MQSLYAYFQSDERDIVKTEKEMFSRVDKILELYFYMLSIIHELHHFAELRIEEAKRKQLPTAEDLNPNTRFVDNQVIAALVDNMEYQREIKNRKVNWTHQDDLIRSLYQQLTSSELYQNYLNDKNSSFHLDKEFVVSLYYKFIFDNVDLHSILDEKSIFWGDDYENSCMMLVQTFKQFDSEFDPAKPLARLFKEHVVKNVEEDRKFMIDLFRNTISNDTWFGELIAEKTKNWDVDRIAIMDILLMKMALCELTEFETIPVKVSLNEYIEIAKVYSTPKSKFFINGVLDKIVIDLKRSKKIEKIGRGLVE